MKLERKVYPFTAIVGQEKMKLALIINVINPTLGGVLIRGEKGTAKSTAVRALADLLPKRDVIKGCRFGCDHKSAEYACADCMDKIANNEPFEIEQRKMRVIDLPISATEDRVVGTLDIEHALKKGEKKFEAGILADANRNILYVDEINLLDDHVVDLLLDSAAMGMNFIEREGISYSHPSRFTLVGTMNPEEGDLRPQLLDRFGLVVDVASENDTSQRAEVVRRRLAFEYDPNQFGKKYQCDQEELEGKIVEASKLLPQVTFDDKLLETAAKISVSFGVDGHRADIVMIKTAMTIAAYHGKHKADMEDLKEAASLVLPHRMRKRPFEDSILDLELIEEKVNEMIV